MEIYNDDIVGIYNRVNRFVIELIKSASANVNDINEHDNIRIVNYLNSLQAYINWVVSQNQLDLPETHPKTTTLEDAPAIPLMENLMIKDLIGLFLRARDEIINSQSARNSNGLIPFDLARINAVIQKSRAYLVDYVEKVIPIDMPESTPNSPTTGGGNTGV